MDIWDERFISLARHISAWSKDPSTKCGAVIIDEKRRVMGVGYNGFPRGVADTENRLLDRPEKYATIVHADVNAILNAQRTEGCTMYIWPMLPCPECAKLIIQSGIGVVAAPRLSEDLEPRWKKSIEFAKAMMREAGVVVLELGEDEDVSGDSVET